jgi:hypothetical protein
MMKEPDVSETDRLRRHLRAMSAVNRQLQAQIDGGAVRFVSAGGADDRSGDIDVRGAGLRVRRVPDGSMWLEQLRIHGSSVPPFLAHAPRRGVFVVEGTVCRRVDSGLLYAALKRVLGDARDVSDSEVDGLTEGPPVEVFEASSGPPFLVVGGRRLAVHGLPLPYPVSTDEMMLFPEGEKLDVAQTGGRREPRGRVARVQELVAREGAVAAAVAMARKAASRVRPGPKPSAESGR